MRAPHPSPLAAPFRAELQQLEQRLLRAALLDFGVFLYGNDAPSSKQQHSSGSHSRPPSPYTRDNLSSTSSGSTAAPCPHRTLILDGRYWKRVKSLETLTAYKARDHIVDKSAFVTAALAASQHGRALPRPTPVAVVGSVTGSLSDVLYGLLTTSTPDLLLRSSYMGQDESSASVLAEMARPTEDEPFRSAGVHWVVRGGSAKKTHPTEFVVLEATGMVDDHVGYHLRCSVPWSSDDDLDGFQSIPRGWMASVALFREVGDGHIVDVCARTVLGGDGGPKSSSADARAAAAVALSAVGEAARCGQQKKLVWMVLDRIRIRGDGPGPDGEHPTARLGGHVPPAPRADMSRCGACDKKFGALHSVGTCAMCALQMCSRCRLTRPLRAVVRASVADVVGEDVETRPVVLCKSCLGTAGALDARTAAEVEALRFGPDPADESVPKEGAEDEEDDEDEDIELFGWERESSGHHRESMGRPSAASDAVRTSAIERTDADEDEDFGTWTPSVSGTEHRPRVVLFAPTVASGRRLSSSMSSSVDRSSASTAAAATSFSSSMVGPVSSSSSWAPSPSASDASSAWSDGDVDEEIDTAAYYHPPHLEDELSLSQAPYHNASQQDLWRTMAALRVAAESTYQLTRQIASQAQQPPSQSQRR